MILFFFSKCDSKHGLNEFNNLFNSITQWNAGKRRQKHEKKKKKIFEGLKA